MTFNRHGRRTPAALPRPSPFASRSNCPWVAIYPVGRSVGQEQKAFVVVNRGDADIRADDARGTHFESRSAQDSDVTMAQRMCDGQVFGPTVRNVPSVCSMTLCVCNSGVGRVRVNSPNNLCMRIYVYMELVSIHFSEKLNCLQEYGS